MQKTKRTVILCSAVLAAMLIAACSALEEEREPEQETKKWTVAALSAAEAATSTPTSTPEPTPTPTLEPTPEPTPEPEAFSIAWMSDTQEYAAKNNDVFGRMTQWISDTQQEYNTVLTVHTGDIVYNPYKEYQWENSSAAFARLPEDMRILTVAGNHDQLPDYDSHTPYLDNRPDTDFDPQHAFDEKGYNYYTVFTAGGVPLIVFSLSYGFESDAADWVNEICKEYSDHYAIICLHSYMSVGGYSSIGRRVFSRVVKQSPNIRLVLSGHEEGMVYIPESLDGNDDGVPDHAVHQMMMNVQGDIYNGVGYLRILRFDPNTDTIEVITYSPVLDRYGYKQYNGDHFGERKMLEDAGLSDFLMKNAQNES